MYASTSCKTCTRVHAYIQLEHAAHQLCVWMEFQILFWPTERQEFARADKAPPLKACLTLILTCWQQHVVHSMHKIYKLTHGQETISKLLSNKHRALVKGQWNATLPSKLSHSHTCQSSNTSVLNGSVDIDTSLRVVWRVLWRYAHKQYSIHGYVSSW